jgi:hypothetical protein
MKNNSEQASPDTNRSRKTYQQPQLQVYGDLRDITQSQMMGPKIDGSMSTSYNKTA